jgi:hypothetical protein
LPYFCSPRFVARNRWEGPAPITGNTVSHRSDVTAKTEAVQAMTDQNKAMQPERSWQRPLTESDRLPGRRDGLPPGALGGLPPDPQGDENRDPPANAPAIPE